MEALVKKLAMNVLLRVDNLTIKYEEEDVVASINLWSVPSKRTCICTYTHIVLECA